MGALIGSPSGVGDGKEGVEGEGHDVDVDGITADELRLLEGDVIGHDVDAARRGVHLEGDRRGHAGADARQKGAGDETAVLIGEGRDLVDEVLVGEAKEEVEHGDHADVKQGQEGEPLADADEADDENGDVEGEIEDRIEVRIEAVRGDRMPRGHVDDLDEGLRDTGDATTDEVKRTRDLEVGDVTWRHERAEAKREKEGREHNDQNGPTLMYRSFKDRVVI